MAKAYTWYAPNGAMVDGFRTLTWGSTYVSTTEPDISASNDKDHDGGVLFEPDGYSTVYDDAEYIEWLPHHLRRMEREGTDEPPEKVDAWPAEIVDACKREADLRCAGEVMRIALQCLPAGFMDQFATAALEVYVTRRAADEAEALKERIEAWKLEDPARCDVVMPEDEDAEEEEAAA